jgi:pyruvate dehydrogenase E2 component (dihydrolipoamide acetyltransferase)
MAVDVLMPPLSQTLDTMVLVEWLKRPGEPVAKGEPLLLVESDKATLEVESPASGVVGALLVEAGEEVPIKARIAVIEQPGAQIAPPAGVAPAAPAPTQVSAAPRPPPARATRIFASPRARRLAAELGVELAVLTASGPDGLIVERDVRAALERQSDARTPAPRVKVSPVAARVAAAHELDAAALAPPEGGRVRRADVEHAVEQAEPPGVPLDAVRRAVAVRLHAAHLAAVPVTLTREVDATRLLAVRDEVLATLTGEEPRPTLTDFLALVAARALLRHPAANGTFDGERLQLSDAVHMALAVDTERGLLAPVIRDCDRLGLLEIAAARTRLAAAARAGRLDAEAAAGGTFTLTNLGPLKVDAFTPVINPPQIAILGVGRARAVPMVVGGAIEVRQAMVLSLTFDHRVLDGAPAARFLDGVAQLVEQPQRIWLHLGTPT